MKLDDPEVQEAVARLQSLGVIQGISSKRRLPPRRPAGSLAFWVLRAADAGFAFELEGPAETVPWGNFWVFDARFLSKLLRGMQALAPGSFRPTDIVDQPTDTGEQHLFSFRLNQRLHELVLDPDGLSSADCNVCLAKVFDFVNQALVKAKAPYVFLGVEGDRIQHSNCQYRVLAVNASRVNDLRAILPVCFGPADSAVSQAAWEATRIRRPEEVVGADRILVEDAEIVDAPEEYVSLVEDLARLAGSELALGNLRCASSRPDGEWIVAWSVDGAELSIRLPAKGWVAAPPLVAALNQSLPHTTTHRFFEFREPDWGQEIGILFADPDQARELRENGFLIE